MSDMTRRADQGTKESDVCEVKSNGNNLALGAGKIGIGAQQQVVQLVRRRGSTSSSVGHVGRLGPRGQRLSRPFSSITQQRDSSFTLSLLFMMAEMDTRQNVYSCTEQVLFSPLFGCLDNGA